MSKYKKAWLKVFENLNLREQILMNGSAEITSDQLKKLGEETRLLSSNTTKNNLPTLGEDNIQLSILPLAKGKFKIGPYNIYHKIENIEDYNEFQSYERTTPSDILACPELQSESINILRALSYGIFSNFLEVNDHNELQISGFGKFSAGDFSFSIRNHLLEKEETISVSGSQIEVDLILEDTKNIYLIEAKNGILGNVNIRQLYYPMRALSHKLKTSKKLVPILFNQNGDVILIKKIQFTNPNNIESIDITKTALYDIAIENVSTHIIREYINNNPVIEESFEIPFPQADSIIIVIDIANECYKKGTLNYDFFMKKYNFDKRQRHYYYKAAEYLNLIESNSKYISLTNMGRKIFSDKNIEIEIIKSILLHEPFRYVFTNSIENGRIMSIQEIKDYLVSLKRDKKVNIDVKNLDALEDNKTIRRRASTVSSWINWIHSKIEP